MKKKTGVMLALMVALLNAGCQGTRVEFSDVPLDRLDLSSGRKIVGKASGLYLFDAIPIAVNDRQMRAYQRLKDEAGSEYITDIRIADSWKFVFIGFKYSTVMTATAYPQKVEQSNRNATTLTQKLEELKRLREKGDLSEAEFESERKKTLGQ